MVYAFLGRGSSTLFDAVSHTIVGYLVVIITIAGLLSLSSIKVGFFKKIFDDLRYVIDLL